MSISINWITKVISIPKTYLSHVSGDIYEMNLNTFRLALKSIEDSEDGMSFVDTHRHFTQTIIGGITYARLIEIINGYTVTFEDGQYLVNLVGANSNVADVTNHNQVSVRSANSAGLIIMVSGSGVTEQDKEDIANEVWDKEDRGVKIDTIAVKTREIHQIQRGRWELDEDTCRLIYYDALDSVPLVIFQLLDDEGNPSIEKVFQRVPIQ